MPPVEQPANTLVFNSISPPERPPQPAPSSGQASPGRERKRRVWMTVLAVALAAVLVFNASYFAVIKPRDDERIRGEYQSLVTEIFSKLTELTGDKYAKTAIQTFQSMQQV